MLCKQNKRLGVKETTGLVAKGRLRIDDGVGKRG